MFLNCFILLYVTLTKTYKKAFLPKPIKNQRPQKLSKINKMS